MSEVTRLIQTDDMPLGVNAYFVPSTGEMKVRASLSVADRREAVREMMAAARVARQQRDAEVSAPMRGA
jgi:hypothetical protein